MDHVIGRPSDGDAILAEAPVDPIQRPHSGLYRFYQSPTCLELRVRKSKGGLLGTFAVQRACLQ